MARCSAFTCANEPNPHCSPGTQHHQDLHWHRRSHRHEGQEGNPPQSLCSQPLPLMLPGQPTSLSGGEVWKDGLRLWYLCLHQPSPGETDVRVFTQQNLRNSVTLFQALGNSSDFFKKGPCPHGAYTLMEYSRTKVFARRKLDVKGSPPLAGRQTSFIKA